MKLTLPKIYPITDRLLSGLNHAEQVRRLIDGGATLVQLREKHLPSADFIREAEAAWKIARDNHVELIINDRVDIAIAIGATGVHLGQDDLPVKAARRVTKASIMIGLSTHTLPQVETALGLPINYVAFGPVFETSSKRDHQPLVGLDQLRAVKDVIGDLPLVAIGGITAANLRDVLDAGADSVAVIGGVLSNPAEIAQNMRQLREIAAA